MSSPPDPSAQIGWADANPGDDEPGHPRRPVHQFRAHQYPAGQRPTYPPDAGGSAAGYPPMPPATGQEPFDPTVTGPPPPRELRLVVILLIANVVLSIVLTVLTITFRHSIVNYQLDHRHITDPTQREVLRRGYAGTMISRVAGNVIVSIVYIFLVRALLRGRRWAYRRVIWIGCAGVIALVAVQLTPYPVWIRVEQVTQAVVLAALVACVLRPAVKAHFAPHLPGRQVRRFNR